MNDKRTPVIRELRRRRRVRAEKLAEMEDALHKFKEAFEHWHGRYILADEKIQSLEAENPNATTRRYA